MLIKDRHVASGSLRMAPGVSCQQQCLDLFNLNHPSSTWHCTFA